MSDPGAKISAAILRHNEARKQTLALAEQIARDRNALTSVVAGVSSSLPPAATITSENGGEQ